MKIVVANPPNIEAIAAAFPIRKGVIFCYGDTIYVPDGGDVSMSLQTHEAVHSFRQGTQIEHWWECYIRDPEFRLAEEIPAHRAEYSYVCAEIKDRNKRSFRLMQMADRLSSPLYGSMISYQKAIAAIARS